jgi:progressive ankylosis protein
MIYFELLKFLLPLILTVIVQEMGLQVLNGGMARAAQATETLAAYGLAWGITMFLQGPLAQGRQLGLVLVDSRDAFSHVHRFVVGVGLLLAGVLVALGTTPLGVWLVEDVHQVTPELSEVVRRAFFWLVPIPALAGLNRLYMGMLMQVRRTDVVSAAMIAGIAASIGSVFVLLPTEFIQSDPIRLPLAATYASAVTELAIVTWGRMRWVHLPDQSEDSALTLALVIRFFWPLAFIMAIQGLSRPVINLFVSRSSDGAESLAVLTVVYALAHVPYGWVNEGRSLHTAFKNVPNHLYYVKRFVLGCGLVSFGSMALLFWTPIRIVLLEDWIGVSGVLADHAVMPLFLFSFFPLTVAVRAYFHGVGLLERRTRAMAPSAPARIGAIVVVMTLFSGSGIHGATLGIGALLCGFVCEAATVWWCVKYRP